MKKEMVIFSGLRFLSDRTDLFIYY